MGESRVRVRESVDLSVDFCGFKLRNPVGNASGVLSTTGPMLKQIADVGAGFVVTKTIGLEDQPGYPNPTLIEPMKNVFLNAMGLPNPGCLEFASEIPIAKSGGVPVVVSIFGRTTDEFAKVATAMDRAGADMIEINISCPHPKKTSRAPIVGQDPEQTREVLTAVRDAVTKPLIVKLSPNVTDIGKFARVAVECKIDAISAINTLQAMEVDPILEIPVLGNKFGGQSGPSIRCIALKKVADIALTLEEMEKSGELQKEVPVIGVGGIRCAEDVIRFMLVGAKCVQVGSAIRYDDLDIFPKIVSGLEKHMKKKGYRSFDELRGKALNALRH